MPENKDYIIPRHTAIIMDGNGRWAKARGKPRTFGHKSGAEAFKRTVNASIKLEVPFVTFYAFSTENWKRPKTEVKALFELFNIYLDDFTDLHKKNARLNFIGDFTEFDKKLSAKMNNAEQLTLDNTGTTISIALNYGGRDEIVNAAKSLLKSGIQPEELDADVFSQRLYTHDLPDVDLLIRTGGDRRISNFLLWQSAYAELAFSSVLWPDFGEDDLIEAFRQYSTRERRFGGL